MNKISIDHTENYNEIIEFLARIFGPNYFDAKIIQGMIIRNEPTTKPENLIIARSEGELIGLVRIVERQIYVKERVLNCGVISSVGVRPDWRGKGIVEQLLNTAHTEMIQRGIDASFLYGRKVLDGYYTKFGYSGIGSYIDLEIISPVEDNCLSVSPTFNKDEIMGLYNKTYSRLSGSVVRNKEIWYFLTAKIVREKKTLLQCYKDNYLVGYLIIDGDRLIEIAMLQDCYKYIPAALHDNGIKQISIHPLHPFSVFVRRNYNSIQHERIVLDGGYQVRFLNEPFDITGFHTSYLDEV